MTDNIRIGGSSADRIINCPGSVAMSAAAANPASSNEAREGTAAHRVAQLCLDQGHDPEDFVGRVVERIEVTPDMAASVLVYVEFVRGWFTSPDGQSDIDAKAATHIESLVDLHDIDPACEGTCDAYQYLPNSRTLRVADFKFGAGVAVNVLDNNQLLFYAAGALNAVSGPVEQIELTIVQPNCPHEDGDVRSVTVSILDLFEFGCRLSNAIQISRSPKPPLKAGSQCQFCPASGYCPELYRAAKQAAEFEIEDDRIAATGGALEQDETARRLNLAEPLRHWLSAIRRYAWFEAQRGRPPLGYKLVATQPRDRWVKDADIDALLSGIAISTETPIEDFYKQKPKSPRQVRLLAGKKKLPANFVKCVERSSSGASLVPVTDKRDELAPSIDLEFLDILESESNE